MNKKKIKIVPIDQANEILIIKVKHKCKTVNISKMLGTEIEVKSVLERRTRTHDTIFPGQRANQ